MQDDKYKIMYTSVIAENYQIVRNVKGFTPVAMIFELLISSGSNGDALYSTGQVRLFPSFTAILYDEPLPINHPGISEVIYFYVFYIDLVFT